MKIDANEKIILTHVGLVLLLLAGCFGWSRSHETNGYDVILWAFFNAIFIALDFIFVFAISFSKKLEKRSKYQHWIGFGLALLLSFPICFSLANLL